MTIIEDCLIEEVRSRIGCSLDDEEFIELCLEIAAAQGRLSEGTGLRAIDPVPEGAFKLMTVACFYPSGAQAEFVTSGTTSSSKGRHLVRDLSLYRKSVLAGFERFVMYQPRPKWFISLVPAWEERPKSSLSAMASIVAEGLDFTETAFVRHGQLLDMGNFFAALEHARQTDLPIVVMGTTLDFLTLVEALETEGAQALPLGSRIVHTGGAKASGREIRIDEFRNQIRRWLGIPPEDVIEEYGMTELLSQAYDSPRVTKGPRRFVPVGWMRTRVVDPVTLADVREGERGLLLHYDLANVYTAVAILTSDLGRRIHDGFYDISRVTGAPSRGCSAEAATSWRGK